MASLLDALQQKLQPAPVSAPGGVGSATENTGNLLREKLTGQATPSTGAPARIATGEQVAAQQGKADQTSLSGDLALKQQQQQSQSSSQEQNADIQRQQDIQDREHKKQAFTQQTDNILQEFARGNKQLKSASDIADLEQVGFMARLQNTQYLDDLNKAATEAGIKTDLDFKEQYQNQVFADSQSAFQGNLNFKKAMDADSADFKQLMSTMSIDQAIQFATLATKTAQTGAAISAASQVATGGLQVAQTYSQDQKTKQYITDKYAADPEQQKKALDAYSQGLWYPQDGALK